jgi:putative transposase
MLSYAKSINKERERTGSLFQKPFRRKYITATSDLKMVSAYIHHNVIHHKCGYDLTDYAWSSYNTIIQDYKTKLARKELLQWYGGKDNFINFCEAYRQHKWELENFYMEEN